MEQKKTSGFRRLALRISTLVLACWLLCAVLLTWAVAADMREQVEHATMEIVHGNINFRGDRFLDEDTKNLPGSAEVNTISYLPNLYYFFGLDPLLPVVLPQQPDSMSSTDWYWGKNDLLYGLEPAAVFYDEAGNIIAKSHDYIAFSYTTEENWKTGKDEAVGFGYIDISEIADIQKLDRFMEVFPGGQNFVSMLGKQLRMTGYFEGNRFYPICVDAMYGQWENVFTLSADAGVQTQTIYAWDLNGFAHDLDPIRFEGVTYDTLADLIENRPGYTEGGNLWESVIIRPSPEQEDYHGKYSYVLAVRCWPIPYAFVRLLPFYLISGALVWLGLYLLMRRLRINLFIPMKRLCDAQRSGTTLHPFAVWEEVYALETSFAESRQWAAELNAKLQQQETALTYARDAEEKRKQLISNVTHELKTPLAVIHSYAEALREDVDRKKQERYLSVILEESEQMDAMVLQLLDLSRLESGKVRLASDRFSLLQLTRQIEEKFVYLLEEKELRLIYSRAEDFLILADSQRIGQVITNLFSNAVNYTPHGGKIGIHISADRNGTHFSITNTVEEPLSKDTIENVWNSFYRGDPARSERGTGLGLAIVKQIITLHGGCCQVNNTSYRDHECVEYCVKFGFTLPTGNRIDFQSDV